VGKSAQFIARFWSAAVAFVVLGLVVLTRFPLPEPTPRIVFSELDLAVASTASITLLVHSIVTQRRYTRTLQGRTLIRLFLLLPALAALWLGLNVIRVYSYAPDAGLNVCWFVVETQDVIVWSGGILGVVVAIWSSIEGALWVVKRFLPQVSH
jgi:hypothetical protein